MALSMAGQDAFDLMRKLSREDMEILHGMLTTLLKPCIVEFGPKPSWNIGDTGKIGDRVKPANMAGARVEIVKINRSRVVVKMIEGPHFSRFSSVPFTVPMSLLVRDITITGECDG
jgi:hypothetical protein